MSKSVSREWCKNIPEDGVLVKYCSQIYLVHKFGGVYLSDKYNTFKIHHEYAIPLTREEIVRLLVNEDIKEPTEQQLAAQLIKNNGGNIESLALWALDYIRKVDSASKPLERELALQIESSKKEG